MLGLAWLVMGELMLDLMLDALFGCRVIRDAQHTDCSMPVDQRDYHGQFLKFLALFFQAAVAADVAKARAVIDLNACGFRR